MDMDIESRKKVEDFIMEAIRRETDGKIDGKEVYIGQGRDLPCNWRDISNVLWDLGYRNHSVEEFWHPRLAGTPIDELDWYLVPIKN